MKNRTLFRLLCLVLAAMMLLIACKEEAPAVTYEGTYSLQKAECGGQDVTAKFLNYNVTLQKDGRMTVNINYGGSFSRRTSTYTATASSIIETYNGKTYTYTVQGDILTTTYAGPEGEITVTLSCKQEQAQKQPVDFQSILFGEDVSQSKKFNYCPAIITETDDEGREVMHIWYCTNKDDGVIMDHIGYRTGVQQADGKWLFSDEEIVLAPTDGTWDGRHTCDPAVIKGEFKMQGETYHYLMAYLGCTTEDYQKNETGLAVAKDIGGPWVKVDNLNPIVPWYDDGDEATEQGKYESWMGTDRIYWGTGMPSLLSVDGKGEIILLYQSTYRGTGIRRIDLSDLDNPVVKYTTSLSSSGIQNSTGRGCSIGIPDFAFDKETGRLYVVSVTNEKNPADVTLTRVNSHSMVAYVDGLADMEAVSAALESGVYSWNMVGYVGPAETGWERNHNPGMVRDSYGCIPDSSQVGVVVATGHNSWNNENIFTYRLHGWIFPIQKD